jgi:SAM-dependent methyltransferase
MVKAQDGPMADSPDLKATSAATYAATADHFDDAALSFWSRFGTETVARIGLPPGARILDACCGTGASALPAAHAVGPSGYVLGLDLAEPALERARAKAAAQGLANAEFRAVDIEHTGEPTGSYDAVVCVFGVFFLPDMAAAVAELWRVVRPGGTLAVTVWGPRFMEPASTAFWSAVGAELPDLVDPFRPWTRVTGPEALADLLRAGGVPAPEVEAVPATHPLADPDDWWTIVLGTGFRSTVARLEPEAAARVRAASVGYLRGHGVRELEANVVYATARKPIG